MRNVMVAAALALLTTAPIADAAVWLDNTGMGCGWTCPDSQGPMVTGTYRGNDLAHFNVCAANVNNEGYRPGYNLTFSPINGELYHNACVVGYGGRETFVNNTFKCLCGRRFPR